MLKTKCFSCGKDIIKKDENTVNFYGVLREDVPEQGLKKGDKVNLLFKDGERKAMKKTQATKDAIIRANINYYITQGWNKEELITKGFFTKEDFDVYEERQ